MVWNRYLAFSVQPFTFPDQQPAIFYSRQANPNEGTFLTYNLPRIKIRPIDTIDGNFMGSSLQNQTAKIQIWIDAIIGSTVGTGTLPCPDPQIGDKFQETTGVRAGTVWVVTRRNLKQLNLVWDLFCTKLTGTPPG